MVDRERVLPRLDDIERYIKELRQVTPANLEEYLRNVQKRRARGRLLQSAVENVVDTCGLLVAAFRLGLPGEENDLIEKLEHGGVLSVSLSERLRKVCGFRNLLVHEHGRVDDRIVYEALRTRLVDFHEFRRPVVEPVRRASA